MTQATDNETTDKDVQYFRVLAGLTIPIILGALIFSIGALPMTLMVFDGSPALHEIASILVTALSVPVFGVCLFCGLVVVVRTGDWPWHSFASRFVFCWGGFFLNECFLGISEVMRFTIAAASCVFWTVPLFVLVGSKKYQLRIVEILRGKKCETFLRVTAAACVGLYTSAFETLFQDMSIPWVAILILALVDGWVRRMPCLWIQGVSLMSLDHEDTQFIRKQDAKVMLSNLPVMFWGAAAVSHAAFALFNILSGPPRQAKFGTIVQVYSLLLALGCFIPMKKFTQEKEWKVFAAIVTSWIPFIVVLFLMSRYIPRYDSGVLTTSVELMLAAPIVYAAVVMVREMKRSVATKNYTTVEIGDVSGVL